MNTTLQELRIERGLIALLQALPEEQVPVLNRLIEAEDQGAIEHFLKEQIPDWEKRLTP